MFELIRTILVTGGGGFIGRNLVGYFYGLGVRVILVDPAREQWNQENLAGLPQDRIHVYRNEIGKTQAITELLKKYMPQSVLHLAAESHVDKSIASPELFLKTNVDETYRLLEAVTCYWNDRDCPQDFRFHYCSTDEVYGSIKTGSFHEVQTLHPNNPYSATKAAGEHLVTAWNNTYGLPIVITRSSNNYGMFQGPDKFIPLTIGRCLRREPVLIHGTGQNVRDWIHVSDHVRGIHQAIQFGHVGEIYNIGGGKKSERTNIEIAEMICDFIDQERHERVGTSRELITLTNNRPGNDLRYSMNTTKLQLQTGWKPIVKLKAGLRETVKWYVNNPIYCEKAR
jgi:dTDP-glucose 4,6-dehydratase